MKLQNGYGSVTKLSGKRRKPWCVRVTTGWDIDADTQRVIQIRKVVGTYETRKEALIALADYNKDPYDLGMASMTFSELYDKWSDAHFEKVSQSNVNGYKASYKLCSKIWNMRVMDIKLPHLQMIVDDSGKNTPTLKKLKIMLGLMYEYAVRNEILSQDKRDMIRYIDISKPGNPNAYNRKPFTKKDIQKIWSAKDGNIYCTVILIMIYTGLRIGELINLRKKDVNLEERWLYVRESKTKAGIREVPIAEKVVPFFEYWLSRNCENLICSPTDEEFQYDNFYDSYWIPLMIDLEFGEWIITDKGKKSYKGHKPHDTRHTCVSLLTSAGVDERLIKKIVGHKGQGVTETVYTHIELSDKLKAINSI